MVVASMVSNHDFYIFLWTVSDDVRGTSSVHVHKHHKCLSIPSEV